VYFGLEADFSEKKKIYLPKKCHLGIYTAEPLYHDQPLDRIELVVLAAPGWSR